MGPDMAYGSEDLRHGGGEAAGTGDVARGVEQALGGAAVAGGVLGTVTGAAELATALTAARDAHAVTSRSVAEGHADLDVRAQQTAALGDQLEVDTAAIAAGATP